LIFVLEVGGWWLPQSSLLGHLLALEKRLSLVPQMRILLLPVQNAQGKKAQHVSKVHYPLPHVLEKQTTMEERFND
jgi:hypothetical protein